MVRGDTMLMGRSVYKWMASILVFVLMMAVVSGACMYLGRRAGAGVRVNVTACSSTVAILETTADTDSTILEPLASTKKPTSSTGTVDEEVDVAALSSTSHGQIPVVPDSEPMLGMVVDEVRDDSIGPSTVKYLHEIIYVTHKPMHISISNGKDEIMEWIDEVLHNRTVWPDPLGENGSEKETVEFDVNGNRRLHQISGGADKKDKVEVEDDGTSSTVSDDPEKEKSETDVHGNGPLHPISGDAEKRDKVEVEDHGTSTTVPGDPEKEEKGETDIHGNRPFLVDLGGTHREETDDAHFFSDPKNDEMNEPHVHENRRLSPDSGDEKKEDTVEIGDHENRALPTDLRDEKREEIVSMRAHENRTLSTVSNDENKEEMNATRAHENRALSPVSSDEKKEEMNATRAHENRTLSTVSIDEKKEEMDSMRTHENRALSPKFGDSKREEMNEMRAHHKRALSLFSSDYKINDKTNEASRQKEENLSKIPSDDLKMKKLTRRAAIMKRKILNLDR